ncbi:zinc-binding dehydrogenase [Rhodococcus erythropolis]|uniref:zinc-binding dehydrogenase n=1 Tax=Rhodococcus erythropolis TaxID=1833 RepID=UPI003D0D12C9
MQAVLLETINGNIIPTLSAMDRPELRPGHVRAAWINRADLLIRAAHPLLNNIAVIGAGGAEYMRADPSYPARQRTALESLLRAGKLIVAEPTVYPMERAADALRALDSRAASGKIVITLA